MKKIMLVAVVALMATVNVNAQNSESKNEIGISWGAGVSTVTDAVGSSIGWGITDYYSNSDWDNKVGTGTIGVEYFRHLNNPKVAIGGIVTIAHFGEDVVRKDNNAKIGERNRDYFTVMPAVKYSWINKEHFALYSKAAAGVMVICVNDKNLENGKKASENGTFFMYQVSAIGAEFGGKVRGFVEIGAGEQGFVLAGLKYKF